MNLKAVKCYYKFVSSVIKYRKLDKITKENIHIKIVIHIIINLYAVRKYGRISLVICLSSHPH